MNYVVVYLNTAGFPAFAFVTADNITEVKKHFKLFYPNCDLKSIYISIEDMRNFLTMCLRG